MELTGEFLGNEFRNKDYKLLDREAISGYKLLMIVYVG